MRGLRIGASGVFEGRPFELVGRLQLRWPGGSWKEWLMRFDDGREGWLSEARESYGVSFKAEGAVIPPKSGLYPETRIQIGDFLYTVDGIKNAACAESEGELPFPAPQGRRSFRVELSSDEGGIACIDYADEGNALYVGRPVELEELGLSG